jgi:hypothetical protein
MMIRKLDLFPPSGEGVEKAPTQLGPLQIANLNHWATPVRFTHLFNPSAWFAVTLTSRHLNRLLRFVVTLTFGCRHYFKRP